MYQSNKTNGKLKLAARQTIAGRRGLLDGRLLFPGFADTNSMTRLGDFCKFLRTNCSQKQPKYLATFQAIVKNATFYVKLICIFSGNFWRILGYFLLQHLVPLDAKNTRPPFGIWLPEMRPAKKSSRYCCCCCLNRSKLNENDARYGFYFKYVNLDR